MLVDCRTLPAGHVVEADVCIVGGGAAGIALALSLSGSGQKVSLIESGSEYPDVRTQALYAGRNVGRAYFGLDGCRTRLFGGSTNCWTGLCRPLDPIDFEARAAVPDSGWPFTFDDLVPYYRRAQPLCQVGPFDYDPAAWAGSGDRAPLPFARRVVTRMFQFSPPTNFGRVHGKSLIESKDVTVHMNGNVVDIATDAEARHVTGLAIACLDGPRLRVRARAYVLACGAIENARLLLAANSVSTNGLGNRHDLVGRYFMEHPHLDLDGFVQPSRVDLGTRLYTPHEVRGTRVTGYLTLAEEVLRGEGLTNVTLTFYFATKEVSDEHTSSARSVASVVHEIDRGAPLDAARRPGMWGVNSAFEQIPNRESRVTLDPSERDELGVPRSVLDWRLTARDKRNLRRVHRIVAEEFARAGLGRFRITLRDDDEWPDAVHGGFHHMGTTRMNDAPERGVVDRNGRVHGMDNLFVAGASVFPTSGAANPTLTIVALALRLADHLRETVR
jgi:choline dehydrogenase-like flavoprotein